MLPKCVLNLSVNAHRCVLLSTCYNQNISGKVLYSEYQLTQRLRSGRRAEYRCLCVLSCGRVVYINLSIRVSGCKDWRTGRRADKGRQRDRTWPLHTSAHSRCARPVKSPAGTRRDTEASSLAEEPSFNGCWGRDTWGVNNKMTTVENDVMKLGRPSGNQRGIVVDRSNQNT